MGYSPKDDQVRVDLWKPSGKWYETTALTWDRYFYIQAGTTELIHETFARCMKEQYPNRWSGMRAT